MGPYERLDRDNLRTQPLRSEVDAASVTAIEANSKNVIASNDYLRIPVHTHTQTRTPKKGMVRQKEEKVSTD